MRCLFPENGEATKHLQIHHDTFANSKFPEGKQGPSKGSSVTGYETAGIWRPFILLTLHE